MGIIKIIIYSTSKGAEPYSTWEDELDVRAKAAVKNRLDRIKLGNFGNAKVIKGAKGIWELLHRLWPRIQDLFWQKGYNNSYFINGWGQGEPGAGH